MFLLFPSLSLFISLLPFLFVHITSGLFLQTSPPRNGSNIYLSLYESCLAEVARTIEQLYGANVGGSPALATNQRGATAAARNEQSSAHSPLAPTAFRTAAAGPVLRHAPFSPCPALWALPLLLSRPRVSPAFVLSSADPPRSSGTAKRARYPETAVSDHRGFVD